MLEIILAVAVFTGVVLVLSGVILAARSRLVETGDVTITVNDERRLVLPAGGKLLTTLGEAGLLLPSACGGKGTCGQCRVCVSQGGGGMLPTEAALLSPRDAEQDIRLACQVGVKRDLSVRVPDEVFGVRQWTSTVRSNRSVATYIREVVFELPEDEPVDFRAGGYILVERPPGEVSYAAFDIEPAFRPEWEQYDLFRHRSVVSEPTTRAYSMANYPGEQGIVMLNIRIALPPPGATGAPPGIVSSYLFSLKPGDKVRLAGPYGEFFARNTDAEMVFVGGGAGMAPMRAHILDQLERIGTKRKMTFWYGARSRQEIFYQADFDRLETEHENFSWHVALSEAKPEDEWHGYTGFIHKVLHDHYLDKHPAPDECEYYLCGPPVMSGAVMRMLDELGVERENILLDDFGG